MKSLTVKLTDGAELVLMCSGGEGSYLSCSLLSSRLGIRYAFFAAPLDGGLAASLSHGSLFLGGGVVFVPAPARADVAQFLSDAMAELERVRAGMSAEVPLTIDGAAGATGV